MASELPEGSGARGFWLQFCGGLAIAGCAFGSLLGAAFRRPILGAAILAMALPMLGVSALIIYYVMYGPNC